jgi:hypothetical protein
MAPTDRPPLSWRSTSIRAVMMFACRSLTRAVMLR